MRNAHRVLLVSLIGLGLSCKASEKLGPGGPGGQAAVDTVRITQGNFSVAVAATTTLSAVTVDAQGNVLAGRVVTWASSNTAAATIDPNTGVVTGVAVGTTTITATSETKTGTVTGTITATPVGSITITPPTDTIALGDSVQLSATVKDTAGITLTGVGVVWSTQNSSVVSVSTLGPLTVLARGAGVGKDTLMATAGPVTAKAVIVVVPVPVASVTVTPSSPAPLPVAGAFQQFQAVAKDAAGKTINGLPVTWTSSNTAVASISTTGLAISGLSYGSTTIGATIGGVQGIVTLTVVVQFTSISANGEHTCGVTTLHAGYCWGLSAFGEVGDGSSPGVAFFGPVPTAGSQQYTLIDVGFVHSCGLATNHTTFCWGRNNLGQLGTSGAQSLIPTQVSGGLLFDSLTAGGNHNCALTSAGVAYCWGDNSLGQVGDNSSGNFRSAPTAVAGGLVFVDISAGDQHTCGVAQGGAAYCWGDNSGGQLGTGNATPSSVPVAVSGGLTFISVSAGGLHSCGVTSNNSAYCWGANSFGELGDATNSPSPTPVQVFGSSSYVTINAGSDHTCAIRVSGAANGGAVDCWGSHQNRQLGDADTAAINRSIPTAVAGPTSVMVSAGQAHTCSVTANSIAYCWGRNAFGEVGNNTQNPPSIPAAGVHIPAKVLGQP